MSIRQLAKLANVAPVTVSMALRNHPRISIETRRRIQKLAAAHNYQVDGKVTELMRSIRKHSPEQFAGSMGLFSLYDVQAPWKLPNREYLGKIISGMQKRAAELGYRIDNLWLNQPGMTPQRFCGILEARGIEGLLCIGAPKIDSKLPPELLRFTIVTVGASIVNPVHRVMANCAQDTIQLLSALKERGYRRPGLVVSMENDARTGHLISAIYLHQIRFVYGLTDTPVFISDETADVPAFCEWIRSFHTDVIIVSTEPARLLAKASVAELNLRVPDDIGVAGVGFHFEKTSLSGVQQDQEQLGLQAVDLLFGRLQRRDLGFPNVPRMQLGVGRWIEGSTLRPASTAAHASTDLRSAPAPDTT